MATSNAVIDAARIEVLNTKVDGVILTQRETKDAVRETNEALRELTSAVSKLGVLEERQINATAATERAFKALEQHEARLKALEAQSPINNLTNGVVGKVVMAVIAAVVGAMLSTIMTRAPQPATVTIQQPTIQQPR